MNDVPGASPPRDLRRLQAAQEPDDGRQRLMTELAEALPGAVFQLVRDARDRIHYRYVSRRVQEVLGVTADAVRDDPLLPARLVIAEDSAALFGAYRDSALAMTPLSVDVRIARPDGVQRWVRTFASPCAEDGQLVWNGYWNDVTEEVDARARTAAAERRIREIIAALPGAIYQFRVDPGGAVQTTFLSEGVLDLVGVTAQGRRDVTAQFRTILPEDLALVSAAIRDAVAQMQRLHVDFRIRHKGSGEVRWIRSVGQPQRESDGSTIINGFWQDITQARELEQALRDARDRSAQAERRLREITETLPGVVYRLVFENGKPTQITDMTDGAYAIYGLTAEQITQDPTVLTRMIHPDDHVAINRAFIEAARSMKPVTYDFRIIRADGQLRWLRAYSAPRLIENGVAWVGYTTDVSAEHEARASADSAQRQYSEARDVAQAAEQRMKAIFDNTRIGLVMIDADKNFSDANPTLRELLDVADEQEFAREFPAFSPPQQPDGRPSMEKAAEMIDLAFERGYNRFDWMHQTRGGEPRPCEIALTRIELGGKPYIFATMTDLRERVRHEAELKLATDEAKAASLAKSEFLANMSHEIRTPMNAIVGLTHLGLSGGDPSRLRDYLGKIDVAAKSLLQIINDILDFSKIEAGKLTLETTPFDLCGVLDTLSDLLNLRAAEKGLELLFAIEPGLCTQLVGDPLRLGQVLLNLTGNAIKFTERGQVVVRVKAVKKGGDFVRLQFDVADTGIGLSQQEIARLFESFSQADSSTTRRYGGTGLGLAISQRLVDLMDGEIEVASMPGRGSTFSFTARFGLAPATARTHTQTPASLRGMRVLVVDDNSTAVSILQAYLESFGFHVASAGDGERAVAAIRKAGREGFRLVLMDWQMPGMNGIEAARRIRALAQSEPTPQPTVIIMVTAFGREEVERQAKSAGLDGFLIKPVNPSVLLDTIVSAFGSSAVIEAAGAAGPAAQPTFAGARVLLVEDNEINQEVARELLERAGATVDLATNGAEAVAHASAADYDAVLMDVQMPVMDGLEATRRIRALGSPRGRVPIIAMTANAMAEDRGRCIEAGMNDHLGKPVDVDRLHALLNQWIGASRREGTPAAAPDGAGADGVEFDFDAAIRKMADSRTLWERLARRYLESQGAPGLIAGLLVRGERGDAHRQAHTLKGVAATLGLLSLQRAAAALEQRLADGAARAERELAVVAAADETARARIRQHLDS